MMHRVQQGGNIHLSIRPGIISHLTEHVASDLVCPTVHLSLVETISNLGAASLFTRKRTLHFMPKRSRRLTESDSAPNHEAANGFHSVRQHPDRASRYGHLTYISRLCCKTWASVINVLIYDIPALAFDCNVMRNLSMFLYFKAPAHGHIVVVGV